MDGGTYPWPSNIKTKNDKYIAIKSHIMNTLDMANSIATKVIWEDRVTGAIFGTRHDNIFIAAISLLRPDLQGSLSWVWDPKVRQDFTECLASVGITEVRGFMPKTSVLRTSSFKDRHSLCDESFEQEAIIPHEEQLRCDVFSLKLDQPGE